MPVGWEWLGAVQQLMGREDAAVPARGRADVQVESATVGLRISNALRTMSTEEGR